MSDRSGASGIRRGSAKSSSRNINLLKLTSDDTGPTIFERKRFTIMPDALKEKNSKDGGSNAITSSFNSDCSSVNQNPNMRIDIQSMNSEKPKNGMN